MSEKALKEFNDALHNPKFKNTWILLQSLADIYESHNVICLEWLDEINRRVEKGLIKTDKNLKDESTT